MQSLNRTSPKRVVVSLLVGAAAGAAITTVQYLFGLFDANGAAHFFQYWIPKGSSIFGLSFVVWLAGILVFGGPVWALLHILKRRNISDALIVGAIIPFLVMLSFSTRFFTGQSDSNFRFFRSGNYTWVDGQMTAFGWRMAIINAAEYAAIGAFIAFTIWHLAYRRGK